MVYSVVETEKPMRILLVEDEKKVADIIVRGLKAERFAVDVCHDGQSGWESADTYNYDLIILDLMLPGLTGTEILEKVRRKNAQVPVLGIGVRLPRDRQEANVHKLAEATADYLGMKGGIPRDAVVANCDYVGDGYGIPTEGMANAVQMLAREEGILLDPVYSGKAMAGMIDLIRSGKIGKDQTVVFLHTGGAVGLFGYTGYLETAMEA